MLLRWLDCWRGVGDVAVGMHRQGWIQLSEYGNGHRGAAFYVTGDGPLGLRRFGVRADGLASGPAGGVAGVEQEGGMMTQLARKASPVVMLLLASVSTASAECAWVLWQQSKHVNMPDAPVIQDYPHVLRGAFETHPKCMTAAQKEAEDQARVWSAAKVGRTEASEVTTGGWRYTLAFDAADKKPTSVISETYVCLPDTIDPRGPKGK